MTAFFATAFTTPVAAVATAPAAQAEPWTGPVIKVSQQRVWLSPNKDKVQDKARFTFELDKAAKVTVKVRRSNKSRTLVYKEKLGRYDAGWGHEWTWKGKDNNRDIVRDGTYDAIFVADQVGENGKKRIRSVPVHVDAHFDVPKKPTPSDDTLYPRTTQIHDVIGVTLSGKGRMATVGSVKMRVKNAQGRVVRRLGLSKARWRRSVTSLFDGRDQAGVPLPGGRYTVGFKVTDKAGNTGKSKTVAVNIADKPLVERAQTLVVGPTTSTTVSSLGTAAANAGKSENVRDLDGRPSTTVGQNEPRPFPCGTVVPSTVYSDTGAMSFRSADHCTGDLAIKMAWSGGQVILADLTHEVAPRGLYSSGVAMRGKPTEAGETDTAELFLGAQPAFNYFTHELTFRGVMSPASAEETVTTSPTETVTGPPPRLGYYAKSSEPEFVRWGIATHGTDSFDVADVTLRYSYLTPQP